MTAPVYPLDYPPGRPRLPEEHGSVRGYLQHRRRKTKPCPACCDAWAAYYRNYHQARKANESSDPD